MSLDKHHLIHLVVHWIHSVQHVFDQTRLVAPQLSRRPPRHGATDVDDAPGQDSVTTSFLDLYEDRRARSLEELRVLWTDVMPEAKVSRSRAVDRILDVDWPQGITFAMTATIAFEAIRANRLSRNWTAMCLDYSKDPGTDNSKELGVNHAETSRKSYMNGAGTHFTKAPGTGPDADRATDQHTQATSQLLQHCTPHQFAQRFSTELLHYFSHALFLDKPIHAAADLGLHAQLPSDWCQPFTHLRLITCDTPADICSIGLHILHIPHTPWCLISGNLGRSGVEARDMALTALANSLGARRILLPHKSQQPALVKTGKLGELKGRDPLALRTLLLEAGLAQDHHPAGKVPGGKGRAMRRHEAEDGPLVRPEKRRREDRSGLYAEANNDVARTEGNDEHLDPVEQRRRARRHAAHLRKRQREAEDLFGASVHVVDQADLPRLERIQYDVYLPFPDHVGYHAVPSALLQQHPITLRFDGTHVLAGLRTLVHAGLDASTDSSKHTHARLRGLPTWLTEVRGTRVRVGYEGHDDDSEPESVLTETPTDGERTQDMAENSYGGTPE